jgi:hypothetical protein
MVGPKPLDTSKYQRVIAFEIGKHQRVIAFEIGKYQRVIAFEIGPPITPTDCRDHVVTDGHRTPDPLRLKPIGDPTGVNARVGGGHDSSGLPKLFGAPSCRGGSAGLKSRGLVTRNGGGARA